MVDHLHGDAAGCGFVEGAGGVAVECCPGFFVDLGLEGGLERLVGVVCPEEVGMADEETLFVVVGVDKPAGDALGPVAAHFAGGGVEDIHAVDLDLDLAVSGVEDVDVRLAEDDEEVALAGVLEVVGHVQVGIHARLEHGDAAEFVELRGVGVVVEGAGDEHIKAAITGLTGSGNQIGAGNGTELRADEDGCAFFRRQMSSFTFQITAFGADQIARPGGEGGKDNLVFLVGLLDPGGLEVFQDHLGEVPLLSIASSLILQRHRSIRHQHPPPARGGATGSPP